MVLLKLLTFLGLYIGILISLVQKVKFSGLFFVSPPDGFLQWIRLIGFRLNIQSDWYAYDTFWVGIKSISSDVRNSHSSKTFELSKTQNLAQDIDIGSCTANRLVLCYRKTEPTIFYRPNRQIKHDYQLYSVSISPDDKYVAVGGSNGNCKIYSNQGSSELNLQGHLDDVTSTQFFPSSKVLLTGSSDFTLRIWSIENGLCAAKLVGHTSSIERTGIIERGMNIISCARDGKICLWHCGSSSCLGEWKFEAPVVDLSVSSMRSDYNSVQEQSPISNYNKKEGVDLVENSKNPPTEVGTENKLAIGAVETVGAIGIDTRTKNQIFKVSCSSISSCNIILNSWKTSLMTGDCNGTVECWDMRCLKMPLYSLSRSTASISRIITSASSSDNVWIGTNDGSCSLWTNIHSNQPNVKSECTGPLYEGIRDVAVGDQEIWTACRDGELRSYQCN